MAGVRRSRFIAQLSWFTAASFCAYAVFAVIFGVVCMVGGHNVMEMIYGGTATYVLAIATGLEVAWLTADT